MQCDYIIEIYKILIFPLVALPYRLKHRFLCERTINGPFTLKVLSHVESDASSGATVRLTEKIE